MLAALALIVQSSVLVAPLHHAETSPQPPAVAALRLLDEPGRPGSAQVAARQLLAGLRAPGEFVGIVQAAASRRHFARTGVIGIHPPGLLAPPIETVLEKLSVGELAPPFESEGGAWIVQRIEAAVGCRQIFVAGADQAARARAEHLATLARGGGDFAALAREHSADTASALRGGDFAIFERGANDAGLRAAAFAASVGEIVGPLATPLGYHVLQRVGVQAIDPRLRDDTWARVRAIWVTYDGAVGAPLSVERSFPAAEALAEELATRLRRGADMAELAREHSDDFGLRELGGDCGWVRRGVTRMPELFDRVFVTAPGALIGPVTTNAGFLLLRREDRGSRSRLDLRVEPLFDQAQWLRALAQDTGAQVPELVGAGVAAAREIEAALGSPLGWSWIEGRLHGCATAADFAARVEELPESFEAPGGSKLPLRALGQRWAASLAELESFHSSEVWPQHQRAIEARLAPLRARLGALAPVALERCVDALGLVEPCASVPVYLVARAPWPGAVTHRSRGGAFCCVSVERREGAALIEAVVHELCHALEAADSASRGASARLRRAIVASGVESAEALANDAAHALVFVTGAWVVRTVFEREHRDLGESEGAYERLGAAARVVRPIWAEHLAGAIELDAAVARVVEGLREEQR